MHILENLALNCGCKIKEPSVQQVYVPLEFSKYITIDNGDFVNEKTYDFFNGVLGIVRPFLLERGIKIIQISKLDKAETINGVDRDVCATTFRQKAYLIYHSLLHVSVDSFSAQVSGLYNKKTVFVPSVLHEGNSKPFFSSEKNLRVVQAEVEMKPSLFSPEQVKRVNQTKPEDIARAMLELLDIPFNFPYETVLIGNDFNRTVVESIPNATFQISNNQTVDLRLDYYYDEQILATQLQLNKCHIVTNKIIPINILNGFKQQITKITYIIDNSHDPRFISAVQKMGIKYSLCTYDIENVEKYKIHYMDYGIITLKEKFSFEQLIKNERNKDLKIDDLYYVSNKMLQNKEKVYPGFLGHIEGLDPETLLNKFPNDPIKRIVYKAQDNDFFWRDINNYWLLKKTNEDQ